MRSVTQKESDRFIMFFRYAAIWLAMLCLSLSSFAQKDTVHLAEVEVIDSLYNLDNLHKTFGSISENPALDARVNLKTNGPESLSTLNYRGGSSSQLSVRWNGISINSPMLGQLDASLVPFNLFEEINISPTAEDKANVGISGDLNIVSTSENKENSISLLLGSKSFNHKTIQGEANASFKSYTGSIKAFRKTGLNNFRIPNDDVALFQRHAKFTYTGLLIFQNFQLGKKDQIETHFWTQDRNSQLPPHILQNTSQSHQFDNFIRSQLKYTHTYRKGHVALQLAYANDDNHFIDSLNAIDALNHFEQYDARLLHETHLKEDLRISGNLSFSQQEGSSENYIETISRKLLENNLRLVKQNRKSQASIIWGTLWEDELHHSFSFEYSCLLDKTLRITAIAGRNFRLPSLNELYWRPGGNSDLKTENAHSFELKIQQAIRKGRSLIKPELSLYLRETTNWILWNFNPQNFIWSAQNINEVKTMGMDLRIPTVIRFSAKTHNKLDVSASFISSEFQDAHELPDIEKGDQILYTPRFAMGIINELRIKTFSIESIYQIRSESRGVLYQIDDYSLFHLAVGKRNYIGNTLIEIEFAMRNAFNTRYERVERRPLPGRHYTLNIKANLFKK